MYLLAIDPGTTESGYVIIDSETRKPLEKEKINNHHLLPKVIDLYPHITGKCVIEMIEGRGVTVSSTVFETCCWIGRFEQAWARETGDEYPTRMYRRTVKQHICGTPAANDSGVIQALCDRFAYNEPNYGKGTKSAPGFFHGFKGDIWQAYALGTAYLDMLPDMEVSW